MKLEPLTAESFGALKQSDPAYYTGRWPYLNVAVQMAMEEPPTRVLELGPYRRPLFLGCDLMDRHNYLKAGSVDIIHDATQVPWPVEDRTYDLFVALQVWEHLRPKQSEAFAEVRRVAKRAVLSFPYKWTRVPKDDVHFDIDMETISKWTQGEVPRRSTIVDSPNPEYKRLVCLYVF